VTRMYNKVTLHLPSDVCICIKCVKDYARHRNYGNSLGFVTLSD